MEQDTQPPPPPPPPAEAATRGTVMDRRMLFLVFFFAAYFYLLYEFARILSPFAGPLVGAVMLALIFHPVHDYFIAHVKNDTICAGLSTSIVLLTIIMPILILAWLLVTEAQVVVPEFRDWIASRGDLQTAAAQLSLPAPLDGIWRTVQGYVEHWQVDLRTVTMEALREMGNRFTTIGAATVKSFLVLILDLVVLILTLFFLFRDGRRIVRWVMDLVPMEDENKYMILERLDRTMSAIIRGAFITAAAQGVLVGLGLAGTGVPFPVMLGFAAALLSVVPIVGCSLVWGPAAAYLFFDGHTGAAIGLAVWGLMVVGMLDNVLRPYLVGERAQLPILLLLVGILGGIKTYGLIGALVAPLIIACVLSFAQIYREQYVHDRAESAAPPPTSPT